MTFTVTPDFRGFANRAISEAVGKPWEALGRGPDSFDCWGFVRWVYGKAGVEIPNFPYADGEERSMIIHNGTMQFERVEKHPYSIVTFGRAGIPSHVGIYHPNGIYYHCVRGKGVCGDRFDTIRHAFNTLDYWYPLCK